MNTHRNLYQQVAALLKPTETWRQDTTDRDLWHHASGVIVNSAALDQREPYYTIIRVGAADSAYGQEQPDLNLQPLG